MWQGLVSSSLLITLALWCWEHWLFLTFCHSLQVLLYSPSSHYSSYDVNLPAYRKGRRLSKDLSLYSTTLKLHPASLPLTSQNSFAQLSPKCKRAWTKVMCSAQTKKHSLNNGRSEVAMSGQWPTLTPYTWVKVLKVPCSYSAPSQATPGASPSQQPTPASTQVVLLYWALSYWQICC